MNLPAIKRRTGGLPWLRLVVLVWLIALSSAAIINGLQLSQLAARTEAALQPSELGPLHERLDTLEQRLQSLERKPAAVMQTRFAKSQQAVETRLATLEQALAQQASGEDLMTVQARLEQIDVRLNQLQSAARSPQRPRTSPRPAAKAAPSLPLKLLGIETRGGVRFASVAPRAAQSFSQIQLLRPGEVQQDWVLQRIERQSAVFQRDDQTLVLAVTRE